MKRIHLIVPLLVLPVLAAAAPAGSVQRSFHDAVTSPRYSFDVTLDAPNGQHAWLKVDGWDLVTHRFYGSIGRDLHSGLRAAVTGTLVGPGTDPRALHYHMHFVATEGRPPRPGAPAPVQTTFDGELTAQVRTWTSTARGTYAVSGTSQVLGHPRRTGTWTAHSVVDPTG